MDVKNDKLRGKIHISDELLTMAVTDIALAVQGVYSMGDSRGNLVIKPGAEVTNRKGIIVTRANKKTTIDLFVQVTYGTRIPTLAWELQKKVKEGVESITGDELEAVNIHVQGVKREN